MAAIGIMFVAVVGFGVYVATTDGPITAYNANDFDAVCEGDWIKNAADFGEPYHIVAFFYGLGYNRTDWWSVGSGSSAASDDFPQINGVACLTRKEATAVKTATCQDLDAGAHIDIDYLSVDYDVELRAAKTGKVVRNLGVVKGTARTCPAMTSYDRRTKKIYARPDEKAVTALLEKFTG